MTSPINPTNLERLTAAGALYVASWPGNIRVSEALKPLREEVMSLLTGANSSHSAFLKDKVFLSYFWIELDGPQGTATCSGIHANGCARAIDDTEARRILFELDLSPAVFSLLSGGEEEAVKPSPVWSLHDKARATAAALRLTLQTPVHRHLAEELGAVVKAKPDIYLALCDDPELADERTYIVSHAALQEQALTPNEIQFAGGTPFREGAVCLGCIELGLIHGRDPVITSEIWLGEEGGARYARH